MKNISIRILSVLLLSVFCFSGCAKQSKNTSTDGPDEVISEGKTTQKVASDYLGLAYYANEKVNPILSQSKINNSLCQLLYEGLFVINEKFQAENLLCQSWSSEDGRKFTFIIKQGITFWSGKPLTAEDVCYTLNLAGKDEKSIYKKQMEQVSSIKQTGTYTFTLTLNSVNYDFIKLLDIPIFRKGTEEDEFSDGTGPYEPQADGDDTVLSVFGNWHGETKPSAYKKIGLISVTHTDAVLTSFETGDVSMASIERIGTQAQSVKGALDAYKVPTTNLHYLGFNLSEAPFKQPLVRQALSELLDRKTLCSNQLQGYATPAVIPVNPQPSDYNAEKVFNKTDAVDKLKQAGITDTDGDGKLEYQNDRGKKQDFAFTVLVNEENEFKVSVLNRYAEDLASVGIQMTVDPVTYDDFQKKLVKKDFDLYYGETIMTSDFNLSPLLAVGGALNYGGVTDFDELITSVRSYQDGTEKTTAQKALYKTFVSSMPIVPIGFEQQQVITRNNLADRINPAPFNIFYQIEKWKRK